MSDGDASFKLKHPKNFLLRFSSHPGFFSISYLTSGLVVEHIRVKRGENGAFHFQKPKNSNPEDFYSVQALMEEQIEKAGAIPVECDSFNEIFRSKSASFYSVDNYTIFLNDDY